MSEDDNNYDPVIHDDIQDDGALVSENDNHYDPVIHDDIHDGSALVSEDDNVSLAAFSMLKAHGGTSLPMGRPMPIQDMIPLLIDSNDALSQVSCGVKENVCFLIDNTKNAEWCQKKKVQ